MNSACPSDFVEVNVYDGNQLVATGKSINAEPVEVSMPRNAKLWSPDSPFLYTLKVTLKSGGKVVDKVDSYAASLDRWTRAGGPTDCIQLPQTRLCCMMYRRRKISVSI